MEKGQQVELLVAYGDHYEEIRERKGYGLRNVKGEVKSDEDPLWRYLRNVENREHVLSILHGMHEFYDVHSVMEYVEEAIRAPLTLLMDSFLDGVANQSDSSNVPSSRQWVALARMHCMSQMFSQQLDTIERTGINVHKAVEAEIAEQVWYELRGTLKEPFEHAIWCPIACDLVVSLSKDVALLTWTDTPDFEELLKRIISKAATFSERVRKSARVFNSGGTELCGLQFQAGVGADSKLILSQASLPCAGFTEGHSLDAKGLMAALNDLQVYSDATALAGSECLLPSFTLPVPKSDEPHVMVKFGNSEKESSLRSAPKSVTRCQEQSACVNSMWYVMWQVVFVANAFATHYIPKGENAIDLFFLPDLCRQIGMDLELAKRCITKGITERVIEGPKRTRIPSQSTSGRRNGG
ncbi:MAG: hypothetical protein SGARI_000350, partial [Bacillariaceae sp.]